MKVTHGVLLFCAVILLAPFFRDETHGYAGQESYYHLRMATYFSHGEIYSQDPAVVSESPYEFNPLHVFLVPFVATLGPSLSSKIVPFLLGLLCAALAAYVARDVFGKPWLFVALLATSPLFIQLFSSITSEGFAIVLLLAGIATIRHKYASPLFFGLVASISFVHAVIAVTIMIVCLPEFKKYSSLIVSVAILVLHALRAIPRAFVVQEPPSLFYEFGNPLGISVMMFLLALMGVYVYWRMKPGRHAFLFVGLGTLLLATVADSFVVYAHLVVITLGAFALDRALSREWDLSLVRNGFFIIIILSAFITTAAVVRDAINAPPSEGLVEAFRFLAMQGQETEVVFTQYTYGDYIPVLAKKRVFSDERSAVYDHIATIDGLELLHTYDPIRIRSILRKYGITYVILTNDMESSLVWDSPGHGLSYTTTLPELFEELYHTDSVRVYRARIARLPILR